MANRYLDGFEWLPTSVGSGISDSDMAKAAWYLSIGNGIRLKADTGRFGYGKCLMVNQGQINGFISTYLKTIPGPTGSDTIQEAYVGCAMYRGSNSDANGWHGIVFWDGVLNVCQISIVLGRNGVIKVFRGNAPIDFDTTTNQLGSSTAGAFEEDEWFYLEARVKIADSGGVVEVRINTVPKVDIPSADTQVTANAYFDMFGVQYGCPVTGITIFCRWDDFYLNDPSGSVNNGYLGNVRVKTMFMIDDGVTNNFIIGGSSPAATNWQSVLNQNLDDTKYVYSSTVDDIDLYVPDPIINAPLVHAVQLRSGLRQDDATQRVAKHLIRVSGVDYENDRDHYTNQTYTHYYSQWQVNPLTGVKFTGAEVNGLEVGIKVQE